MKKFKISIEIEDKFNKDEQEAWKEMNVDQQLLALKEIERATKSEIAAVLNMSEKSIKKVEVNVL